tara:strand:- start:805 stop:993 length:189 start_codon:yes stop_codon:yes gene_type:complete
MTEPENGLGNKFIVAAVQFCSNEDKNRNLKLAGTYIDMPLKMVQALSSCRRCLTAVAIQRLW